MSDILEKYRRKAQELHEQGKTGYECEWCGNGRSTQNNHGIFCAGCCHPKEKVVIVAFGVPVYDIKDAFELLHINAIYLHPGGWEMYDNSPR